MPALLLLLCAGCAPASDAVLLRGASLDTLPDAWLSWRTEARPLDGKVGLLIYADGRAEAVSQLPFGFQEALGGSRTRRRHGVVSEADRAELLKAAVGPLSAPVHPPQGPRGDLEPETEGGGRYIVEIREADGGIRRLRYSHSMLNGHWAGGEPLHPVIERILSGLQE